MCGMELKAFLGMDERLDDETMGFHDPALLRAFSHIVGRSFGFADR